MVKIDVIILSYAATETLQNLTENAVASLHASEDPTLIGFNIVVIESAKHLKDYQYPGTQTLYPKEPFGYHRYMNLGMRATNSDYICLCNNDLLFHKGWATAMITAFDENSTLVSASPYCSFHHQEEGYRSNSGIHYGYKVRGEVAGWCLFFKRSILPIIGGQLDPQFKFWYADNDYAKTLEQKGLVHGLVTESIVDHLESQTLQSKSATEQRKLTSGERFYYEYKWEGRSYWSYLNRLRKFYMNLWWENLKATR
jgi:GT2 family glycosyltransferase